MAKRIVYVTMKRLFWLALLPFLLCAPGTRAQASDARVAAALKLVDLGNAREAADNLRQLTGQEPKNAEAHAGLAIALVNLNQIDQAAPEAEAGFDIDRRNVLVRIARGMVYGKQGKVQDALSEFNQAIKLNDKDVGSLVAISRYYLSIDSLKSAEISLYRAQALNDKDVRSFIGLAELYERQHIPELAIAQYTAAMKIDPSDESVHAKLAGLYLRTRRYNESAKEWLKVIQIDSNYADAYYQIANLYFLAKQYSNAAFYSARYAKLRPNDISGQWLLARSLTENGQYQEALPALQAVAPNDSLRALSQLLLARSYFYSKDYAKALDIFRSAKSLGPKDLGYFGTTLVVSGDTAGGIDQLQKSLVSDTVRIAHEKLETESAIGNLLYQRKDYEGAAKQFDQIAVQTPSVESYLSAGQIWSFAKKPDMAKADYDKALAINPNSLKVLMQVARDQVSINAGSDTALAVFTKLDEVAKASGSADTAAIAEGFLSYHAAANKDWKKVVEILAPAVQILEAGKSPYLVSFMLLLGQSYHQIQNLELAKKYYTKVIELDPENKGAKEGLEFLKQSAKSEKK
jgi:tetratricopeptide (TPR) repeat protein